MLEAEVTDQPFYFSKSGELVRSEILKHEKDKHTLKLHLGSGSEFKNCFCIFHYPSRMKLPCFHVLQFGLYLDRVQDKSDIKLPENEISWFSYIAVQASHVRWKTPNVRINQNEDEVDSGEDESNTENLPKHT